MKCERYGGAQLRRVRVGGGVLGAGAVAVAVAARVVINRSSVNVHRGAAADWVAAAAEHRVDAARDARKPKQRKGRDAAQRNQHRDEREGGGPARAAAGGGDRGVGIELEYCQHLVVPPQRDGLRRAGGAPNLRLRREGADDPACEARGALRAALDVAPKAGLHDGDDEKGDGGDPHDRRCEDAQGEDDALAFRARRADIAPRLGSVLPHRAPHQRRLRRRRGEAASSERVPRARRAAVALPQSAQRRCIFTRRDAAADAARLYIGRRAARRGRAAAEAAAASQQDVRRSELRGVVKAA